MSTVAAVQATAANVSAAFTVLSALQLTASTWPQSASLKNLSSFDFIIAGGGSSGSILANRLTENGNFNVLVIEAGKYPELEATYPATVPYLLKSAADWDFTTEATSFTEGYHTAGGIYYPSGKMLGGSGSLPIKAHLHTRSNPEFFDNWATELNDQSWNYNSILQYFIKSEKVYDEEILNSEYKSYHGTNGPIGLTRYKYDEIEDYLKAVEECGNRIVLDINGKDGVGYFLPLLELHNETYQNPGRKYLAPIKERPNLFVLTESLVTKILFNDYNTASAVEVTDSSNNTWIFEANKEIIIATGAIKTPQLLMLSGIGPKEHLESFNIQVISDLPVGQNYQDLYGSLVMHKMKAANASTAAVSPYAPGPIFVGFSSLNKSETAKPDYMAENIIVSGGDTTIVALCSLYFGFNNDICQTYLDAQASNDLLFTTVIKLDPQSRGKILLQSTDPRDNPLIDGGFFNDSQDLSDIVEYLKDYTTVVNSTYFKSVGAEFLAPNLSECASYELYSEDYWNCYAPRMMISIYKYMSTASMGKVVDTQLKVKGVSGLRIVDASVFPNATHSHPMSTVAMVAEKASDMILADYAITLAK